MVACAESRGAGAPYATWQKRGTVSAVPSNGTDDGNLTTVGRPLASSAALRTESHQTRVGHQNKRASFAIPRPSVREEVPRGSA